VKNFGTVYYDENAIANIFGLADMIKKHRVTFDSEKENAFLVHRSGEDIIRFHMSTEGLYVCPMNVTSDNTKLKSAHNNLVSTVKENRFPYNAREFERAKVARRLYHIVGTPTVENFKKLLKMNSIHNCPVTTVDVDIAEKIFGPSLSSLKGKSTRSKPKPVKQDLIEIPKEILESHKELELCMDTIFINKQGFLTTIDRSIKYRSVVPIEDKKIEEYHRAIDVVLRKYNHAGFVIKTIQCDREYKPMMDAVKDDLNIVMNYTNTADHVPEAERNNRTIKERY
jgi:hypothetical protein